MKIKQLTLGLYATNCYIVYDEATRDSVVIDPGYTPEVILQELEQLQLQPQAILLTHGHFDHVGGVAPLYAELGCRVYLCQKDTQLPPYITAGQLCYTDFYAEGDDLTFGALRFHVIETPGHTPGSVCLLCEDVIFSGDTLFKGSCGRTDGPGGSWKDMCRSLQRLAEIQRDYQVLPGHGEATTLRREQLYNAFMQEARGQ